MRRINLVSGAICSVLFITGIFLAQPLSLAAEGKPPSIADITAPDSGQYLCDRTDVTGSADCKRFSHWILTYKAIEDVGWVELTQSFSRAKDELLQEWITCEPYEPYNPSEPNELCERLDEGLYNLRLAVYSNRKLEAEDNVIVNMSYLPCGDCNGDFMVDLEDLNCFLDWIEGGGPRPCQQRAMDIDLSTLIDTDDLDYMADYVIPYSKDPYPEDPGTAPCAWIIGDVNHDFGYVPNQVDVDYLNAWLWEGGPAPKPLESADMDCSGRIDILDLAYLIDYIFNGGPEPGLACFVCGDFNHVGIVNWDDVIYLRKWLFEGGPQPMPLVSADVDGSGQVDILDLLYLNDHIVNGGPALSCPDPVAELSVMSLNR